MWLKFIRSSDCLLIYLFWLFLGSGLVWFDFHWCWFWGFSVCLSHLCLSCLLVSRSVSASFLDVLKLELYGAISLEINNDWVCVRQGTEGLGLCWARNLRAVDPIPHCTVTVSIHVALQSLFA